MTRRGSGEGGIFQRESDGRWVATVELGKGSNGKRLRKTVYGSTKRQVQAKLKAAQDARDKGIVTSGGNMTVSAWLDQWLDGLDATAKLKASTRRSYREVVDLYVRPHLGHIRLARLTPEDVEKMGRTLSEAGKSGNTQRLARTILRRALGQAERRGYVARNVVALTDAPAVKVDERPVLTPEQAKQLFDALHDDRLLPLYVVAIHTGLRQGELLALRWSDVDLGAGTLTVTGTLDRKIRQRTDPKTDKSRRNVPLTPQAMEALQVHQVRQNLEGTQGSDDLVFTSARGTALYDSNIRKHWHRVSANLGLASMPWHNLRHSAATIMLAQGVPIEVVSRVFGHASIRITADIYGHVSPETNRHAADAMAKALR
jgi:integrase